MSPKKDEPKFPSQQDIPPYEREGYRVLDEYKSSDPASADHLVLAHLASFGADFSKSRHVIHYLYFPTIEGRARAEIQLRGADYVTRFGVEAPGERPWSLIAERTGIVNEQRIADERQLLSRIVREEDGEYDGWEAALD